MARTNFVSWWGQPETQETIQQVQMTLGGTLREAATMVLLLDLLDAVETQRMPMWRREDGEVERVLEEIGA